MRQTDRRILPRVVLFDVGNMLLHVAENPHLTSWRELGCLNEISPDAYTRGVEQAKREWHEAGGAPDLEDLSETWIERYMRALELAGFSGDVAHTARLIEQSFLVNGWQVYPDAKDVLAYLVGGGIRLGVVSNWTERLEATLEEAGLSRYCDVIVSSGVVGYAKPNPAIYGFALECLGADPEESLFVGDSLRLDVEGPLAVGIRSVLIDRDQRFANYGNRIESLSELRDWGL